MCVCVSTSKPFLHVCMQHNRSAGVQSLGQGGNNWGQKEHEWRWEPVGRQPATREGTGLLVSGAPPQLLRPQLAEPSSHSPPSPPSTHPLHITRMRTAVHTACSKLHSTLTRVYSYIYGIAGNVWLQLTPTFLQVGCSALGRGFGVGWKSKKGGRGRRGQ